MCQESQHHGQQCQRGLKGHVDLTCVTLFLLWPITSSPHGFVESLILEMNTELLCNVCNHNGEKAGAKITATTTHF